MEPVMATVILLAVTLSVTLICSNFLVAVPESFMRFENIQILAVEVNAVPNGWQLTIDIKNTGSADALIDNLSINGRLTSTLGLSTSPDLTAGPYRIEAGSMGSLRVVIPAGTPGCASGSTVDITLRVQAGREYMQMVSLT
jgi:hypothetical protein